MKKFAAILACALLVLAGCTREFKLKPKLELTEALGQHIQQAMIDYAVKNPEFAELVGKTIEGKDIRIADKFIPGDQTVAKYQEFGMVGGKQLFVGDWIFNQEKMLIACVDASENGTVFTYQAPFTVTDGKVTITKIKVDKSSTQAEK